MDDDDDEDDDDNEADPILHVMMILECYGGEHSKKEANFLHDARLPT
jgi:hypothetical protein